MYNKFNKSVGGSGKKDDLHKDLQANNNSQSLRNQPHRYNFKVIRNNGNAGTYTNKCMVIAIMQACMICKTTQFSEFIRNAHQLHIDDIFAKLPFPGSKHELWDSDKPKHQKFLQDLCELLMIRIEIFYANSEKFGQGWWLGKKQHQYGRKDVPRWRWFSIVAWGEHFELIISRTDFTNEIRHDRIPIELINLVRIVNDNNIHRSVKSFIGIDKEIVGDDSHLQIVLNKHTKPYVNQSPVFLHKEFEQSHESINLILDDELNVVSDYSINHVINNPINIDPTNIDPTNIDPTNIDPTNIDPTNIDPTNIDPTNIDPTHNDIMTIVSRPLINMFNYIRGNLPNENISQQNQMNSEYLTLDISVEEYQEQKQALLEFEKKQQKKDLIKSIKEKLNNNAIVEKDIILQNIEMSYADKMIVQDKFTIISQQLEKMLAEQNKLIQMINEVELG